MASHTLPDFTSQNGTDYKINIDASLADHESQLSNPTAGVWTPTIQDASLSDAEGQTYGPQVGTYQVVGNVCFVQGFLAIVSLGTLAPGDVGALGGLPFPSVASANQQGVLQLGATIGMALTAQDVPFLTVPTGVNYARFRKWGVTNGNTDLTLTGVGVSQFSISGFYFI